MNHWRSVCAPRRWQMSAGSSTFWVTWDRQLRPCGMMTEPGVPLAPGGFGESWREIRRLREEIMVPAKCSACAMSHACDQCAAVCYAESGSFTAESTEMTGSIFARYALGMSAFAVLDLLNKAYYAMKKTLVPLLINLGVLVLNLILNRVFYTDTGVALATSLALTIGAIAMTIQLFHGTKIVRLVPLIKGLIATAAMAVVLYGGHSMLVTADDSKLMLVVKCGLTGVVGCVIYVLVSMILKQNIIADTIRKFKK